MRARSGAWWGGGGDGTHGTERTYGGGRLERALGSGGAAGVGEERGRVVREGALAGASGSWTLVCASGSGTLACASGSMGGGGARSAITPSGVADSATSPAGRGGGGGVRLRDEGVGGLAAAVAGGGGLGGVGDDGEVGEGLAGLGDGVGEDELVAEGREAADGGEALLRRVGPGPGLELFEGDLGVLADVEEGHGAVEEEAEEEGLLSG